MIELSDKNVVVNCVEGLFEIKKDATGKVFVVQGLSNGFSDLYKSMVSGMFFCENQIDKNIYIENPLRKNILGYALSSLESC